MIKPLFGVSLNLLDDNSFEHIKDLAVGRRLVIIDTLRRFHEEDENVSGPMAKVISRMESICVETDCSFIFIHHSSKGAAILVINSNRAEDQVFWWII